MLPGSECPYVFASGYGYMDWMLVVRACIRVERVCLTVFVQMLD